MKGFYSITILAIVAIILMFLAFAMISLGNQRKSSVAIMESDLVAEKSSEALNFFNSTIHDAVIDSAFEAYNCSVQPQNFCSYLNSTLINYFSNSSLILSNVTGLSSTQPTLTCMNISSNSPNNYTFNVSVSYILTSNFSSFSKSIYENQNWNVFIQNYTPAYINSSNSALCAPENLFEVNTSDFFVSVNCTKQPISTTC
jgi:hypothetical protein